MKLWNTINKTIWFNEDQQTAGFVILLFDCIQVFLGAISNPVNVYMYVYVYVKTAPFDVDKKNEKKLSWLSDKFI